VESWLGLCVEVEARVIQGLFWLVDAQKRIFSGEFRLFLAIHGRAKQTFILVDLIIFR